MTDISKQAANLEPCASDPREGMLQSRIKRVGLTIIGTLFLIIGVSALVIPVLPTTPFLLLAAACYLKGSSRMYRMLMTNRLFGKQLKDYAEGRGVSRNTKILSLSFLWLCLAVSALFFVPYLVVGIILMIIGVAVSVHILSLRTIPSN